MSQPRRVNSNTQLVRTKSGARNQLKKGKEIMEMRHNKGHKARKRGVGEETKINETMHYTKKFAQTVAKYEATFK